MGFLVPIADNGERRQAFSKDKSATGWSEGTEDIIHQGGGSQRAVSSGQRNGRGSATFLEQVCEDGVVTALGGRLGEQAVAFWEVGVVGNTAEAVHAVS